MKNHKLLVILASTGLAAALFASAIASRAQQPAAGAEAVSMYKKGASESVVIVATANSFGVAAVPGAVKALIKAGADAEKVTAAAVSVGANPSAVVNNAVAAGAKSNKVVTAAIEAGADPAIETHDHADDGNVESQHNVDDLHNAEDLHMQRREAPKYTAAPPLVTPVPSGGGGGAPASRS